MTKITINIIEGDDFNIDPSYNSDIILYDQFSNFEIDLTKTTGEFGVAVKGDTQSEIKMAKLNTPNTYDQGNLNFDLSFSSIVAPGKIIKNDNTPFCQIKINNNSYFIYENMLYEKWGEELQDGRHYVITAKLNKSLRSEERRVGKECTTWFRTRW